MKTLFKQLVLPVAATAALAMATGAQAADTLKLAHFVSPAHIITKLMLDPLAEGVKKDSGGELEVQIYPGGELGKGPMEQYVRAMQGVADITWGLAGYTSSQFPKTMVVEMPGVIPEGMNGYDMLWNAYEGHLKGEFPGTRPVAMWVSEPNIFIMKDHVIRKPEDLAGLKLRVSGSVQAALITAYGATPVQMPAPQIYNALQTGLIDGVVTGASAVTDFKLFEVANSYTLGASLGQLMFYLVMNEDRYQGLTDAQKAALDKNIGIGLSKLGEEGWKAAAASTIERLKADANNTVVELSAEEAAPFDAISASIRDQMLAEISDGKAVLAAMQGK